MRPPAERGDADPPVGLGAIAASAPCGAAPRARRAAEPPRTLRRCPPAASSPAPTCPARTALRAYHGEARRHRAGTPPATARLREPRPRGAPHRGRGDTASVRRRGRGKAPPTISGPPPDRGRRYVPPPRGRPLPQQRLVPVPPAQPAVYRPAFPRPRAPLPGTPPPPQPRPPLPHVVGVRGAVRRPLRQPDAVRHRAHPAPVEPPSQQHPPGRLPLRAVHAQKVRLHPAPGNLRGRLRPFFSREVSSGASPAPAAPSAPLAESVCEHP